MELNYLVNILVSCQCGAAYGAERRYRVNDTRWEPVLGLSFSRGTQRQRRQLTRPASTTSSDSLRAVRGVTSEGFMTIVQPTASAGATFQALWQTYI